MILAKNIHKHYGNLEVLRGVDIEIQKGEIVSIVGKSGAGKTTLLQILGTLDTPNAGELHIEGVDVIQLKGKQLSTFRNERVGFIFQFHHLLPEFNAVENVMMPALIGKKSEAASKKRAVELLDYLGLSHRLTHKPGELSGGEQQRVAVARALINSPSVIFADEPTGNLDSALSTDLHQLLFNLRRDFNQTFVIVTHSEELARLSDRRLVMQDGRIIE